MTVPPFKDYCYLYYRQLTARSWFIFSLCSMSKSFQTLVVAMSVMLSGAVSRGDEAKIPLDKLPMGALQAVKTRFPKAEIKEATKEMEDGKTEYEVSIFDEGVEIDVILSEKGAITLIEKTIPMKNVPKVVAEELVSKYPAGKIQKAEELTQVKDGKETISCYEFHLENNGKTIEVEILPDGKVKAGAKKE
jgi:hypothetical protein